MHKGTIKCECGQEFYYETIRSIVTCINCGKQYKVDNVSDTINDQVEKTNESGD